MRDFYKEIDKALQSYEAFKPYHPYSTDWICNRIDWCYKWRKITQEQMEELSNRVMAVLDTELARICRKKGY